MRQGLFPLPDRDPQAGAHQAGRGRPGALRDKTNQAADGSTFEGRNYTEPSESHRAACESEVSPLDEIHDPSFTKPLEARLKAAAEQGLYEPDPWPKPAGEKK